MPLIFYCIKVVVLLAFEILNAQADMKKTVLLLTSIIVMCFSREPVYAGNLINIQLGNLSTLYTDGAAINDGSQTWTQFNRNGTRTYTNLKYSDNTASTVSVTESMSTTGSWVPTVTSFTNVTDLTLMRGALSTGATASGYFYFNGLTSGIYDIYIYSQGKTADPVKNIDINVVTSDGAKSIKFTNDNTASALKEATSSTAGNWYKQTVIVDTAVAGYGTGNNNLIFTMGSNQLINGIQLQYVGPVPVPEPDSVLLLGIGGVFFFGLMRSRASAGSEVCA